MIGRSAPRRCNSHQRNLTGQPPTSLSQMSLPRVRRQMQWHQQYDRVPRATANADFDVHATAKRRHDADVFLIDRKQARKVDAATHDETPAAPVIAFTLRKAQATQAGQLELAPGRKAVQSGSFAAWLQRSFRSAGWNRCSTPGNIEHAARSVFSSGSMPSRVNGCSGRRQAPFPCTLALAQRERSSGIKKPHRPGEDQWGLSGGLQGR